MSSLKIAVPRTVCRYLSLIMVSSNRVVLGILNLMASRIFLSISSNYSLLNFLWPSVSVTRAVLKGLTSSCLQAM